MCVCGRAPAHRPPPPPAPSPPSLVVSLLGCLWSRCCGPHPCVSAQAHPVSRAAFDDRCWCCLGKLFFLLYSSDVAVGSSLFAGSRLSAVVWLLMLGTMKNRTSTEQTRKILANRIATVLRTATCGDDGCSVPQRCPLTDTCGRA
ncbi:hypothetical protein ABB37_08365 [Leptomonas pyrrhocoris]|uniref:Uncharacterized protein n=1 Tax=Leptomonas pyrrhocoris TaxID=157538 RepID=A0A0M9FT06_LEPPY|nr:hypothetical protein ABB37_08365 [Leptomonas pyrrhocoris]KPA75445.1 hypothetical protein ABB37_08365 [Leptomonas pyrrhocoris]|eukprot:XP_015653884.1 hypothetical protein ABB37_08365 [Leptomonas pyrrhocoris]